MALHRLVARVLPLLFLVILTPLPTLAQNQAAPAAASSEQLLKPEQLDALVAPIALYPDNLLSLVLMGSTYPLEVVMADRWVKENKKLKGNQLKAEVDKQAWDDSVKSLVATPDVLSMMSTKMDWTQKLGDAVLAQQPDVMDAIQRLRTKAEANNKLTSTKQQKVTKKQEQGKQVIYIEPTDPETALCAVLRSWRCLRWMALSGVSAILFRVSRIYRRRTHRDRPRIWRWMGTRELGARVEIIGVEESIGTTTTSTSTGQGLTP